MKKIAISMALAISVLAMGQKPAAGADVLPKAEKAYNTLKANFTKHPKDAKAKKEFVDATVIYAHESMMSQTLDRKVKYVQALRLFREALKLDPKNKTAKEESDMIIGIYKQMGRPVPKDGS